MRTIQNDNIIVYRDGLGRIFREDGPAVIYGNDGTEVWTTSLPAVTEASATRSRMGYIHREDGPAIISAEGKETYYLNDEQRMTI